MAETRIGSELEKEPLLKQNHDGPKPRRMGPSEPKSLSRKWLLTILILVFVPLVWSISTIFFVVSVPWISRSNNSRSEGAQHRRYLKSANRILEQNPLMDGHNDLAIRVRGQYKNHIYDSDFQSLWEKGGLSGQVDIPRIQKGHYSGAFWSAFMICPMNVTDYSDEAYAPGKAQQSIQKLPPDEHHTVVRATLDQLDLLQRLSLLYPSYFIPAKNAADALSMFKRGDFMSSYIIEGLHQIGNSVSTLRLYHSLGVRYATLTWNCHNIYADAACITDFMKAGETKPSKPLHHGVSKAGKTLIREMNRLGMMVDLSHVSEETMVDVLRGKDGWNGSIAPPIFSHSSAYALCPHPRNVADHVLQLVKKRNSIVMVNFNPEFISCTAPEDPNEQLPELDQDNNTLAQVVRHIMHIGELIGYDHVGIGTDYDGIGDTPRGLEDVSKMPDLFAALLKEGVSEEDCAKIAGRNILRVWNEVDEVAARMQSAGVMPAEDDLEDPFQ